MAFTQSNITSVRPPVQNGSELLVSWTSTAAPGTVVQVYVDQSLVWSGRALWCSIPLPKALARISVGTVLPGEDQTNFASSLAGAPARQVTLNWSGGTYLADDIAGFHIYGQPTPSASLDQTNILATVPAYVAGIVTDGFGYGGFGGGTFGAAAAAYSWTSGPLSSGTWQWAVTPFDASGNEGPAQLTTAVIETPPGPPAPFADNTRLSYAYSSTTGEITLTWNGRPA